MSEVKKRRDIIKRTSLNYLEDIAEHLIEKLRTFPDDTKKETLKYLKEIQAEIRRKKKALKAPAPPEAPMS